jgi:putative transposase
VKFAFISEERVAFSIAVLCRVMEVSASGYYASLTWAPSLRARRDAELSVHIAAAHKTSHRRYGSPRVHAELRAQGQQVGRKRVARLMRERKLVARRRKRFKATTDSKHLLPIAPNVLARDFTATAPNQRWVTDITFLWTQQGWVYLAAILDLFSRRVVGWAMSRNVDRHLALAALDMALSQRAPRGALVHHSDRGSTYASADYRAALETRGIECSMSRKADCWDNAVAESFFSSLKWEVEGLDNCESYDKAHSLVSDYIDVFYNLHRRHSTIGYLSPVEFELMYCANAA